VEAEMVAAAHERAARLAAKREKQTHDQTRRLLYVSDIGQAHRALERNSLSAALALLERYLPEDEEEDLRGFDWFYLWRQCHREEYEIPAAGWQLAISPNGETIAAGSQDGTIRLIDLA